MGRKSSGSGDAKSNHKRKSWGTTVNVTATNSSGGPTSTMTPEAAAKYIQQATAQAAAAVAASSNGGREVKISFGPSRPPSGNQQAAANSAAATVAAMGGLSAAAMSFGSLDLQALKETAAAAAQAQRNAGKGSGASMPSMEGLPCSEAEMKALMSMFVEIMGGMNMDGTNNNNSNCSNSSSKNSNGGGKRKSDSSKAKNFAAGNPMFMFGGTSSGNASNGGLPPGWPDQESLAAATAGLFANGASWDAIRRTYGAAAFHAGAGDYTDDDDDHDDDGAHHTDDDDSMPDLDDMREIFGKAAALSHEKAHYHQSNHTSSRTSTRPGDPIAPGEWESLEQVAVEDALEAEERARKAAKKREKKQRRKQKQKEEAALKAAEAAQKKRERAVLSWRSRVVSACQSGELPKLEALLQESPLGKPGHATTTIPTASSTSSSSPPPPPSSKSQMNAATTTSTPSQNQTDHHGEESLWSRAVVFPHLEFLLPNSIAKNRSHLERGKDTRYKLASYLLHMDLPLAFLPLRSGRTAFHTACFHGDLSFVRLVLERLASDDVSAASEGSPDDDGRHLLKDCLNRTCDDSGWAPLHYAAVSGCTEALEALLRAGCRLDTITDDTHTWKHSDGRGVTAAELIACLRNGTHEKVLESHGVALQEVEHAFLANQNDRRVFLRHLDRASKRIADVASNGYSPPSHDKAGSGSHENGEDAAATITPTESAAARKRKKKKKKKQAQREASEAAAVASGNHTAIGTNNSVPLSAAKEEPAEVLEDPLVTALLGMGFAKEQISAAVKACGGTNRATADDLVTWILGQDADGGAVGGDGFSLVPGGQSFSDDDGFVVNERTMTKTTSEIKRAEEEARRKEDSAKRLAAKREEQRRRNREWNSREQARQQQQAKAKFAHAVAPARSVAPQMAHAPPEAAAFPALQSSSPGLQAGLPPANVSAVVSRASVAAEGPPLVANSLSTGARTTPATTASAVPQERPTNPDIRASSDFPALSQAAPAPTRFPTVTAVAPPINAQNSFPPIGDDDRTVSSFGSNRGLSVSSAAFVPGAVTHSATTMPVVPSVPPPGFLQSNSMPLKEASEPIGYDADSNPGEMRATAKAFIPKSFSPPPPPTDPLSAVPQLSNNFGAPIGAPLSSSLPEVPTSYPGQLPPGFLGNAGPPPPTTSSLLGAALPSAYDRMPTGTPVSEDISTAQSIGSTLTGVAGLEDQSFGIPGFSNPPKDHTTSLLSSAFTSGPPVSGGSIWGGAAAPAAPGLGGVPHLSFGDATKREEGEQPPQAPPGTINWGGSGGSIW